MLRRARRQGFGRLRHSFSVGAQARSHSCTATILFFMIGQNAKFTRFKIMKNKKPRRGVIVIFVEQMNSKRPKTCRVDMPFLRSFVLLYYDFAATIISSLWD